MEDCNSSQLLCLDSNCDIKGLSHSPGIKPQNYYYPPNLTSNQIQQNISLANESIGVNNVTELNRAAKDDPYKF